jgi:hypothetical protein
MILNERNKNRYRRFFLALLSREVVGHRILGFFIPNHSFNTIKITRRLYQTGGTKNYQNHLL